MAHTASSVEMALPIIKLANTTLSRTGHIWDLGYCPVEAKELVIPCLAVILDRLYIYRYGTMGGMSIEVSADSVWHQNRLWMDCYSDWPCLRSRPSRWDSRLRELTPNRRSNCGATLSADKFSKLLIPLTVYNVLLCQY